ncbi:MAG TPA: hypothetical protein VKI45_08520 [Allosphingosinicella sp.]|nr:hypothetical protein [Allosphingosinicella sp.]
MSEADLSGRWHGFYSYGGHVHACPFEAELRDHGGELVGVSFEIAAFGPNPGSTLTAQLEGRRQGSAVDFAKSYDEVALAGYSIHYAGTLADGGNEIEGTWTIPGQGKGTFLMVREGGAEAEEERRAEETVRR